MDYRPSSAAQERLRQLLDAQHSGRINPAETDELDEFEQLEHFVRMLKLHTLDRFCHSNMLRIDKLNR